ncbi:MAG: hypothetical protein ACI3XQ_01965 [Eubacteriales bacterium]
MGKKNVKKRILIIIGAVILLIILMFAMTLILDKVLTKVRNENEVTADFDFYEPDYDEDIFADEEYAELIKNGLMKYCDLNNVTTDIDADTAVAFGDDAEFMVNLVYSIINGDVDAYNDAFSSLYYTKSSEKDNFTKQKLYDVVITKIYQGTESTTQESYFTATFTLEYKILKNNGTFRNDFMEGSRRQYIQISDREGELKIDSVSVNRYKS